MENKEELPNIFNCIYSLKMEIEKAEEVIEEKKQLIKSCKDLINAFEEEDKDIVKSEENLRTLEGTMKNLILGIIENSFRKCPRIN
jgi:hypothetical protein